MDWQDDAYILSSRKYGEGSAIVELLTRQHGRHKGLVRGAGSTQMRAALQPGNQVQAIWRARLAEHLGHLTVELRRGHAALIMQDRLSLAALASLCATASVCLPEREPLPRVYDAFAVVLQQLADHDGPTAVAALVRWELGVLETLGYGLDLSACAVTGETDGLAFVSPRTGRAVSAAGAGTYASRLLVLPPFLRGAGGDPDGVSLLAGLKLTGYFLDLHALRPHGLALPPARARLADLLEKSAS